MRNIILLLHLICAIVFVISFLNGFICPPIDDGLFLINSTIAFFSFVGTLYTGVRLMIENKK